MKLHVITLLTLVVALTACDLTKKPTTTASQAVDDTAITTKAKAALMADADIKSSNISIETVTGAVTLTGLVASEVQAQKAIDTDRAIEGVISVLNKLTVKQVFYRELDTLRVRVT
ncbi:MAG: BON domain-containing protein [Burkholderiales bacterium]